VGTGRIGVVGGTGVAGCGCVGGCCCCEVEVVVVTAIAEAPGRQNSLGEQERQQKRVEVESAAGVVDDGMFVGIG